MGQDSFDLGDDPAAGHIVKIAANILVINTVEILMEVFTFTGKNGLDPKTFADAITKSLFATPVYKI
ncbi:MAG: NAD-binding protein [Oculatellaceae cyanobacterium bins.114]|nr:NAD-binding protein [Oculatellaceae cyanobacterium bins.114]